MAGLPFSSIRTLLAWGGMLGFASGLKNNCAGGFTEGLTYVEKGGGLGVAEWLRMQRVPLRVRGEVRCRRR